MSSIESQTLANRFKFIAEAVAWRYGSQKKSVRSKVKSELLNDPFYRVLLNYEHLPMSGSVVDFECGIGVFLAYISALRILGKSAGDGRLSPSPLVGLETREDLATLARSALDANASIHLGALETFAIPECRLVLLRKVLLYLTQQEQQRWLEAISARLETGGVLILQEPDIEGFGKASLVRFNIWLDNRLHRNQPRQANPKTIRQWKEQLEALGFEVEIKLPTGEWYLHNPLLFARKINSPQQ